MYDPPTEIPPSNPAAEDPDYYPDAEEDDRNPDEWVAYTLQPFNEDDPF